MIVDLEGKYQTVRLIWSFRLHFSKNWIEMFSFIKSSQMNNSSINVLYV